MDKLSWKERIKQFFCSHWSKASSQVRNDKKEMVAYHSYCADCKKSFDVFISEEATDQQKAFVLRKI